MIWAEDKQREPFVDDNDVANEDKSEMM